MRALRPCGVFHRGESRRVEFGLADAALTDISLVDMQSRSGQPSFDEPTNRPWEQDHQAVSSSSRINGASRSEEQRDHRPYDQSHVQTLLDIETHLDPGGPSSLAPSGTSERFLLAETDQSMKVDLVMLGILTEAEVEWLFGQ